MHDAHQPRALDVETCNERAGVHLACLAVRLIEDRLLALPKHCGLACSRESSRCAWSLHGVRKVNESGYGRLSGSLGLGRKSPWDFSEEILPHLLMNPPRG